MFGGVGGAKSDKDDSRKQPRVKASSDNLAELEGDENAFGDMNNSSGKRAATQREKAMRKINDALSFKSPAERLTWRQAINRTLNEPSSNNIARMTSIFLTLLILISVVMLVLSTVKGFRQDTDLDWHPFELAIALLFTFELALRCAVQYTTVAEVFLDAYFYNDVLAVGPFWIEFTSGASMPPVLSAVRIVRLFKLFRQFQGSITLAAAIEESLAALTVPFFFLVVSATTFGVFLYYVENAGAELEDKHQAFNNIPHAIWFIFVTMTTVGYGDVTPISTLGKLVNIMAMLFGVLFLSMPLAILGNNFCNVWAERDRFTLIARLRDTLMAGGVNKESVTNAFSIIDLDGSGFLNYKEFQHALTMLKIDMPAKKLRRLWNNIDTDGSGEIRVEEFAELLFPEVESIGEEFDPDAEAAEAPGSDPVVNAVKEVMAKQLESLSSQIERQEKDIRDLKQMMEQLLQAVNSTMRPEGLPGTVASP